MTKQIALGIFESLTLNNGHPTWWHPDSREHGWKTVSYWSDLARLAERNGFDFLFFADSYGYAVMDGDLPHEVAAHGIHFHSMDPMPIISALAAVTDRLGFVVTASTGAERPYPFARRMATLDHLTGGRVGWNIVTGGQQVTAAKLIGVDFVKHDQRYDNADEFVELCTRWWEQSWLDDALVKDRHARIYADPSKIRRVQYQGEVFRGDGYFCLEPSPQRTPFLFQAGTSARGRRFAGTWAEGVFVQGTTPERTRLMVDQLRTEADAAGRDGTALKVISGITVITGRTTSEAEDIRDAIVATHDRDDAAVMYYGMTGIDLRRHPQDQPVRRPRTEAGQTLVNRYIKEAERPPAAEVLENFRTRGIRGFELIGTAQEVADRLEALIEETDLDGVMLEPTFGGAGFIADFAENVAPILRERGLLPPLDGLRPGTLRGRLRGQDHRAAARA